MNILDYVNTVPVLNFRAGDWIFHLGEESNGNMYYIFSGTVEAVKTMPDGTKKSIADILPGEVFGEIAILMNTKRRMGVRVKSHLCKVGVINMDLFTKLSHVNPNFLFSILTATLQKIERAEGKLMELEKQAKLMLQLKVQKEASSSGSLADDEG